MLRPNDVAESVLVETVWLNQVHPSPDMRLIEVDTNPDLYFTGHIPQAIPWNWRVDIQDPLQRNIPDNDRFSALLERSGIHPAMTVVLYGDRNNLFATYAFWLLKYYGHADVRLLDGGRKKWMAEGRPMTQTEFHPPPQRYPVRRVETAYRALRDDILSRIDDPNLALIDVRTEKEFTGELLAPEHLPQEGAVRGGHIPGAVNIAWGQNMRPDGTFKSTAELRDLYEAQGITPDKDVITYCRIGERSSLTWFVLRYLLGYPQVRNYDGSWIEWGNLIGAPIERA